MSGENNKKVKELDFSTKSFVANGTTYYIEESLTYARWMEYEKLQVELGFGVAFDSMFSKLGDVYNLLNAQRFADCAVMVRDMMSGVAYNIDNRVPSVLKICGLFINTIGEDRTEVEEAVMQKKYDDWRKEGIAMQSFFLLSANLISGFIAALKSVTQNISAGGEELKNMSTTKKE